MNAVAAAVGAAMAVALAVRPRRHWSTPRPGHDRGAPGAALGDAAPEELGLLLRLRPLLAGLTCVAGWAVIGGPAGVVVGALLSVVAWRILGGVESPAVRRRRELLARQLPAGVQLLAAALRSGTDIESAMMLVAHAMPGPFADQLLALGHELSLGVAPAQVWERAGADPALGPLARTLGRAQETGAAVAEVIDALAVELQARRRSDTRRRAKSVDVRASAPLGLCFLPAFMVLGVVPLVAGIFTSLDFLR